MISQIRSKRMQRITQTITYMPHFISTVVMASIIIMYLSPNNGLYGHIVRALNGTPENLIAKANAFSPIYVITDIW